MKAYAINILSNNGNWGGCHSRIRGYAISPTLAMIRGLEIIKKDYPDDKCKEKWDIGNYHIMGEGANSFANIHNKTNGGMEVSVFIEEIYIEEEPEDIDYDNLIANLEKADV